MTLSHHAMHYSKNARYVVLALRIALLVAVLLGPTGCSGAPKGADGTTSDTTAVVAATTTTAAAEPTVPVDPAVGTRAEEFVRLLAAGRFQEATAQFDETMLAALPAAKLADTWRSLEAQVGPFREAGSARLSRQEGYDVALVRLTFASDALDARVVFDDQGRVAGLFFVPAATAESESDGGFADESPPYVDLSAFTEREVTVGAKGWPLPGTLTVPEGSGPFPAVVLVHGSGPNDRDETIGPNRPFRDLAWGLATRGVVVLRYEKRTKEHAGRMAALGEEITVEEEAVADAVAAVTLLRNPLRGFPAIDAERVFVVGHSLGGTLAPRIADESGGVAGLVLLAAAARPLEDLILEQSQYLAALDGTVDAQEKIALKDLTTRTARVKDPGLGPDTAADLLPLNIPAPYWLDLRSYDTVAVAARLGLPVLALQGSRDYQVTAEDLALWEHGLTRLPDLETHLLPGLDHLFRSGTGLSTPASYDTPGHVDGRVVDLVADWVAARSRP